MARILADIEKEIRELDRSDQERLLRALLEQLESPSEASAAEALHAQIQAELAAANDYVAKHGSFAELVREHYASADDDAV